MMSALRHRVCFLSLVLLASACLPVEEPGTPVTDPDARAGGEDVRTTDAAPLELDLNDVSILLPPPTSANDPVLAVTDLAFDGNSVWPDEVFARFIALSNSEAGAIAGTDVANNQRGSRIDVSAFSDKSVWHVASVRVDPGAPGLSEDIKEQFGQLAQIRLVLQPVTGGRVHDVAAHVIYNFVNTDNVKPPHQGCSVPRFEPDREKFREIVDDLLAMKSALAAGEIGDETIDTSGPLGVHPAAEASAATRVAFRDALKAFLESHLDPTKLRAMAIMGLPRGAPEPWIFMAMAIDPRSGQFAPLPNPTLAQDPGRFRFAQMLDARPPIASNPSVSPAARANNLNPVTCAFEVIVDPNQPNGPKPPDSPSGVSTAELFPDGDAARMEEIVSVIADPTRAHFFNTDCVSCHTETRREMDILGTSEVDAPVDPDVLPTELWNVRNFGWFPPFPSGTPLATVTRRTATETEEVLEAINADLLTQ